MPSNTIKIIKKKFGELFGSADPLLVRSPGRVNLIGEHTDYNDGFVLPAAIDRVIYFGMKANGSDKIRVYSLDFDQFYSFDVTRRPFTKSNLGWPNYLMGVVDQLIKNGYAVGGFDAVFGGTIPIGAGLSSSAALEGGVIYGVTELFNLKTLRLDMVKMGQKTENDFVGVNCGIMDQFINIYGEEQRVLKLDCRSLEFELYPFERDDLAILLCDTQIRRELAESEYNKRRQQCEQGVEFLAAKNPSKNIKNLRDVEIELLEQYKPEMDPLVYRMCRYVIEENTRVLAACNDLNKDHISQFGQRMYASHTGLRDDYEVSCPELDLLVEEAAKMEGVYGARMMGAGFGGCTVNLVHKNAVDTFSYNIEHVYKNRSGKEIEVYQTEIGAGTGVIQPVVNS